VFATGEDASHNRREEPEAAMLETATLTAFFHGLVQDAMQAQQIASSESTECYLVHLLERFAAPDRPDLLDPPLGVDYLRAFELPAAQRFDTLRRVADTALFVTGVFVDCLERGLVGPDYYAALGRNAYAHLSTEMRRGGLGESFVELADRFPDFVRVLGAISALELFRSEQDTLRLYKRWMHTGGRREADLLIRRGLIPVTPPARRQ
jgi:hypothetical protein